MPEPTNKRILIVNAGPVYPIRAMNQMRTHNMIRTLSKDFRVDLLTPYIDNTSLEASSEALRESGGEYIPIVSAKHKKNKFKKRLAQAHEFFNYYVSGTDREVTCNKRNNRNILRIIKEKGYKTVLSNYWESSHFFKNLDGSIYKILDPHYAVKENFDVLEKIRRANGVKYFFERRRLHKNLRVEKEIIESSDLILPLSERNFKEFEKICPGKPMLLIPDGADLEYYFSYTFEPEPETILFYGAMGSDQNKRAFWRLYMNILPELKKGFPDLKLLVVGSSPPRGIKELHNGKDIIVTGFVEDVRPWLGKCWLSIIPLELGSGFRGRIIELMAMGIPVVGTHNALDSIGFQSGKEGFISDSDSELTSYCYKLLRNPELRREISSGSRKFVQERYSIEATFGQLNKYLNKKLTPDTK